MALTKISTGGVKDDAASQAKIADEAIDEARLQVSNAGTNGQFLSKQSGNTGGLTWADAITSIADDSITQAKIADDAIGQDQLAQNAVVADNLTEDCVTSAKIADAAVTEYRIADNNVPESKLKVSNSPTNGQLLSAQSGNTGGLTWTDPPASAPQIEATADGAITAGNTVIVNTNGTVKKAQVLATELGTYTNKNKTLSATNIYKRAITYDENADQIIAVYDRGGTLKASSFAFNADYSSLNIVTEDDTVWSSEAEAVAISYSPDLQKSLVIYTRFSGSGDLYGTFLTSTASGISDSGDTQLASEKHDECSICYDTANDKFILISNDRTAQQAEYRVISISGSTPSVDSTGTISGASSGTGYKNKVVYDSTNNRVYLLRGKYAGNSATGGLKLHIGSLSGTTLTWHNTVTVNSGEQDSDYLDMCWMPDINKLAIFYAVSANIKAKVGTPTGSGGTSSMTLGSAHSVIAGNNLSCAYDPLLQRAVLFYIRTSDNHGGAKSYSVSGTSFTEEKNWTFYNADLNYVSPQTSVTYTKSGQQRVITSVKPQSGSDYKLTIYAWKTADTATNLTTENYIGIAAASASDSATATIDISGAVNSSQSSLTAGQKYYVQNDGSLGLTAATPKVFAGTAVSATKLIVNDQQPMPTGAWTLLDSGTKTTSGAAIVGGSANFIAASCSAYNWFELHWTYHGTATTHFGINGSYNGSGWWTNSDNVIYVDSSYCDGDSATEGNNRRSGDSGDPRLTDAFNSMQNYQGVTTFSFPHDTTRYKFMTTRFGGWNNTMAQYSIKTISGTAIHGNRNSTNALTGIAFWNNAGYGNPVSWRLLGGT